ncbi:sequestosome-1-like [Hylaeus anthracinus]|uniref:sequestosome-1-like n=1 Tax=Hylaeus anthracinus TaxID=313031 RepID=UPI0023BA3990|nr:sequestosome-1-like [Hylaeus anthracinus]
MLKWTDNLNMSFKVYLKNNDGSTKDIRRFTTKTNERVDFNDVCEKLKQFFPELRGNEFTVSWIDVDNDEIRICSDQELEVATKLNPALLRLYVHLCQIPNRGVWNGVVCDGCNNQLKGFRYKCVRCKDYDLCSQCELLGLHADHYMIRISHSQQWSAHHAPRLHRDERKFLKKKAMYFTNNYTFYDGNGREMFNLLKFLKKFDLDMSWIVDIKTGTSSDTSPDTSPDTLNISQTNKTEEKKECQTNITTSQTGTEKIPEKDTKLVIDSIDETFTSDNASVSSAETTIKKAEGTEEWTILDKTDTSDINSTSFISSGLNVLSEKQVSANASMVSSTSKEVDTSDQTIYPQLAKEEESSYHPNPKVREGLSIMLAMGYSNKSGLLTHLLEAEDGDIKKVLDLLD